MVEHAFPADRAWCGPTLGPSTYVVTLSEACLAELDRVVFELRRAPVPTLLLLPEHFELPACARLMDDVRERLDRGPGFVIIDRLPLASTGR